MRVTNNMMSNQFLSGYQTSLSRMTDIQEKMIANKNINRPSDNPIGAARNLQFTSASSTNALFTQNANDAISWMKTSDSNLASMVKTMANIKTAVSSAISANPTTSYQVIEKQVGEMIKELVQAANSQVGDRYVFGGQNDKTEPFTIKYDENGNMTAVVYNGTYGTSDGAIKMQVVPGEINEFRDKINQDGQEVFGDMMTITKTVDVAGVPTPITYNNVPTIFNDLLKIKQHLTDVQTGAIDADTGLVVTPETLSNDLGIIEADRDYIISAQTTVGAKQSSYQTIKDRLIADSLIIAQDAKDNDGFDVAKASIESQLALNAYNTLLSVGANVLPKSLVDYL